MRFKHNFPENYEWIMNKYIEKTGVKYEFDCWKLGKPEKTLFYAKAKTTSELAKKIDKFLSKKTCTK